MDAPSAAIPHRAQTLAVLRLMGDREPILMLGEAADICGTRWMLDGVEVPPAIAKYLLREGYIAKAAVTELGAQCLMITAAGKAFRAAGLRWWRRIGWLGRLRVWICG